MSNTTTSLVGNAGAAEFRRGWPLVLAATVGAALGLSAIPFYEIGLLAPELAREFHWPIATVMGGMFFLLITEAIMSPVIGWLADRFGVRPVALTSIVGFSVSLSLLALQTGSTPLYFATWVLLGVTSAGTLPNTWTRTVNQSFEVHKGLALGIVLAGTGISSFLLKPAVAWVMVGHGWRGGFMLLAVLPITVALPLTWLFFRPVAALTSVARQVGSSAGRTLREAIRDRRFWIIGVSIMPVAFAIAGTIASMEIILKARGVSRATVLQIVPFMGLAVVSGRIIGGWLMDRIWAPAVGLLLLGQAALALWSLGPGAASFAPILPGVIGVGLAAGVEFDLLAFLIARYFGLAHYGGIYGLIYSFFLLGASSAPYVFGRAFDRYHSFDAILAVAAVLIVASALCFLTLGRYRYAVERDSA